MSIFEQITNSIGEKGVSQIAKQLGGDNESISKAISAALPTVLGAMGRKSGESEGQGILQQFLDENDDDAPEDSADYFEQGHHEKRDVMPLLQGILGGKKDRIEDGIGKASGLDKSQVGKLMQMLAPLVINHLSKQGKKENREGSSLFEMIRDGGKDAETKSGSGGLMAQFFDQDNDGDFDLSDVAKIGMGFFKK